jgi:DNA polymerase-3 subunit delta'
MYDLFSLKLSGRIRYYPRYGKELAVLAGQAQVGAMLQALKRLGERRAVAEHPLAARLFIEDMLLDYARLFPS